MAEREVTNTQKSPAGEIVAVSGPWGRRSRSSALVDITHEQHEYFVSTPAGPRPVVIVETEDGKRLRTDPDVARRDPLEDLPDID